MKITKGKGLSILNPDKEFMEIWNGLKEGDVIDLSTAKKGITDAQRNATHKWFELVSNHLNETGNTMDIVLKDGALWARRGLDFKDKIWRPTAQATYGVKSTEDLTPAQVNEIFEAVCAGLAMKGVGDIPGFPSWHTQGE